MKPKDEILRKWKGSLTPPDTPPNMLRHKDGSLHPVPKDFKSVEKTSFFETVLIIVAAAGLLVAIAIIINEFFY